MASTLRVSALPSTLHQHSHGVLRALLRLGAQGSPHCSPWGRKLGQLHTRSWLVRNRGRFFCSSSGEQILLYHPHFSYPQHPTNTCAAGGENLISRWYPGTWFAPQQGAAGAQEPGLLPSKGLQVQPSALERHSPKGIPVLSLLAVPSLAPGQATCV